MEREQSTRIDEEVAAAEEEAASIGGEGEANDDPVSQAGGGVAEGFELAEEELIERAQHGEPGYPGAESFEGREEEDPGTVYGEADHVESQDDGDG